ncbi:MAG: T9SS type A sorting domain-containing protein, partial [Bacteroidales bacterium]|nr:T9SS type A sorting domain-containing protein [Bacteroidales bacterium]
MSSFVSNANNTVVSASDALADLPVLSVVDKNLAFNSRNLTSRPLYIGGFNLTGDISYILEGDDASFFTIQEVGWNPDSGGTLNIRFSGTEGRWYNAVISISSPGADPVSVTLKGLPITVSAESLSFGDVDVNTSTESLVINVTGLSTYNYNISGDSSAFVVDQTTYDPETGIGSYYISFHPREQKNYQAVLEIPYLPSTLNISLSGTGIDNTGTPVIIPSSQNLDFGAHLTGNPVPSKDLFISGNYLSGNISYSLGGDDASDFSVGRSDWDPSTGGSLWVGFFPFEAKQYNAFITISSPDAEPVTIYLTGEGVSNQAPLLNIDKYYMNFESPSVGTESESQLVTITGTGLTGPITYSSQLSDSTEFVVREISWDPETGGTLQITYLPTATTDAFDIIYIESPGAVRKSLTLKGSLGVITPNIIDFGETEVNRTSEPQTITVRGIDLYTASLSIMSVDEGVFSMNITSSSTVDVTFTPTEERDYAELMMLSTSSIIRTVELKGKGIVGADEPGISVDEESMNFMDVPIGETRSHLINVSGSNLTDPITYQLDGENTSVFSIEEIDWDPENGGLLRISFISTELNFFRAAISFRSSGAATKTVDLMGMGAPNIIISDSAIEFDDTEVNSSSSKSISLTVAGSMSISEVFYRIDPQALDTVFTVTQESWDPSTGGIFNINFTPTTPEYHSAYLVISSYVTEDKRIPLSGKGIQDDSRSIAINPENILFENVVVNTPSDMQKIAVSGLNEDSEVICEVEGEDSLFFEAEEPVWSEEEGWLINVLFTPQNARKEYEAALKISVGNDSKSIPLRGIISEDDITSLTTYEVSTVKVYPNPVKDKLIIETNSEYVDIYSIHGVLIESVQTTGQVKVIYLYD